MNLFFCQKTDEDLYDSFAFLGVFVGLVSKIFLGDFELGVESAEIRFDVFYFEFQCLAVCLERLGLFERGLAPRCVAFLAGGRGESWG